MKREDATIPGGLLFQLMLCLPGNRYSSRGNDSLYSACYCHKFPIPDTAIRRIIAESCADD